MTLEICAEMSCNHLGSLDRAKAIVRAAAAAGADLFKVQVWEPDTMCLDRAYKLDGGPWVGRTLFDLYHEAWTPWEWLPELFDLARTLGMEPFGAAFDCASVDYLETLGVKRHKVASFELVDLPLIRYMASKGKPMILSAGMATEAEIIAAVAEASDEVTLLACTSAYPAKSFYLNTGCGWWGFNTKSGAKTKPGLSDHSMGCGVACAAAYIGSVYIEKHLTLARADGGPDAGFSMEPDEFAMMVVECRRAKGAVWAPERGTKPGEAPHLRRSLYVAKDTAAGQPLVLCGNVRTSRPALGLPCDSRLTVALRNLRAGEPLTQECMA